MSTISSLDSLPPEILEIIFSHCNKSSICNLSLASSYLHQPAIQHLYRRILPADARQTIILFWCLVQVPLVASYIRTFHVQAPFCLARDVFRIPAEVEIGRAVTQPAWDDKMDYWTGKAAQSASIHNSQQLRGYAPAAQGSSNDDQFFNRTLDHSLPVAFVEQAFRKMTSLQTLVIHTPAHPHMWTFSCELPALRHVTIHKNADSSLLICWLAKQPALTSLQYSPGPQYMEKWFPIEGPEVESHFLPNLRNIKTNLAGIVLFVPGKPVESLHLEIPKGAGLRESDPNEGNQVNNGQEWRRFVTRETSTNNLARALGASTRTITKLTLSPSSVMELKPFLRMVVESLRFLTHLTITMDYEWGLDPILEEFLGSMPNILVLELPSRRSRPNPKKGVQDSPLQFKEYSLGDREAHLAKITRWISLAPTLSSVFLHPESPIMASLARHSATYGTCKYEASTFEWRILREGETVEIVVIE